MDFVIPLCHPTNAKNRPYGRFSQFSAEEEGFEPPVPRGTTVFKTAAFDHSATPLFGSFAILFYPER